MVIDNVIAGLALDALIVALDGAGLASTRVGNSHGALVQNSRVRSARATIKGVAVQVERDVERGDCDVLLRVGQQLHRCIARCSVNCFLQAEIALAVHFGDGGLSAFLGSWSLGTFSVGRSRGGCFTG